jgi:hypothetical protein
MKKTTNKGALEFAQKKLDELLAMVTNKGGFDKLNSNEQKELNEFTRLVKSYEDTY